MCLKYTIGNDRIMSLGYVREGLHGKITHAGGVAAVPIYSFIMDGR